MKHIYSGGEQPIEVREDQPIRGNVGNECASTTGTCGRKVLEKGELVADIETETINALVLLSVKKYVKIQRRMMMQILTMRRHST